MSYGYYSGNQSKVICRNSSLCNIYCLGYGCYQMEIICLQGAICNIYPLQCQHNYCKLSYDGTFCPNFTTNISSDDYLLSDK